MGSGGLAAACRRNVERPASQAQRWPAPPGSAAGTSYKSARHLQQLPPPLLGFLRQGPATGSSAGADMRQLAQLTSVCPSKLVPSVHYLSSCAMTDKGAAGKGQPEEENAGTLPHPGRL